MNLEARWPVAQICTCGAALEAHDLDVKSRRRIGDDGATVVCPGFALDRVEPVPPPSELRRRLAIAGALHNCRHRCTDAYGETSWYGGDGALPEFASCPTLRAVRGET